MLLKDGKYGPKLMVDGEMNGIRPSTVPYHVHIEGVVALLPLLIVGVMQGSCSGRNFLLQARIHYFTSKTITYSLFNALRTIRIIFSLALTCKCEQTIGKNYVI